MGLVLNALPRPQDQIDSLQRALQDEITRNMNLERELAEMKRERTALSAGLGQLRIVLAPLYQSLQMVFGDLDAMQIDSSGRTASVDPGKRERWERWKQKLKGKTAEAIDILLIHGPMTHAQLRIQLACATRTCSNITGALRRAGLIDVAGGRISLKEL